MNQRLVTGAFAMAISMALLGAAATQFEIANPTLDGQPVALASEVHSLQPTNQARAQVPLRSGFLTGDPEPVDESSFPVAVRIADISLEAPVITVGVDAQNDFDVPAADTVGWYQYSSTPGGPGTTVLAAHVDYAGEEGAFFHLEDVAVGDLLEVEMASGDVMIYEVVESVLYDRTELPAEDLFRKDGPSTLQLITCGGDFDPTARSYRGNLVVTAVPVDAA